MTEKKPVGEKARGAHLAVAHGPTGQKLWRHLPYVTFVALLCAALGKAQRVHHGCCDRDTDNCRFSLSR